MLSSMCAASYYSQSQIKRSRRVCPVKKSDSKIIFPPYKCCSKSEAGVRLSSVGCQVVKAAEPAVASVTVSAAAFAAAAAAAGVFKEELVAIPADAATTPTAAAHADADAAPAADFVAAAAAAFDEEHVATSTDAADAAPTDAATTPTAAAAKAATKIQSQFRANEAKAEFATRKATNNDDAANAAKYAVENNFDSWYANPEDKDVKNVQELIDGASNPPTGFLQQAKKGNILINNWRDTLKATNNGVEPTIPNVSMCQFLSYVRNSPNPGGEARSAKENMTNFCSKNNDQGPDKIATHIVKRFAAKMESEKEGRFSFKGLDHFCVINKLDSSAVKAKLQEAMEARKKHLGDKEGKPLDAHDLPDAVIRKYLDFFKAVIGE